VALKRLKDIFLVLALFGLVAGVIRMVTGLGATTELSDEIPWGIWKVLNMVAGVALATGGFVLAFSVHVLHIKVLKPILRPALMVAFLGYGASCTALMLDIGLPHRFWHPIVYWNPHSFLFEVFWCVLLYFTICAIEVSPMALEKSKFSGIYRIVKKISGPVVIVGITLSTMHHSSLGSLFIVSAGRVHELWYTTWLPVHFILSAIGAGMMAVVLLTLVTAKLYHRIAPVQVLTKVASASAIVLSIYLGTKIFDLYNRGAESLLFNGQWEASLFWVEILIATIIPIAIIAVPRFRRTGAGLVTAASFAVAGALLNRVDVGILAYFRSGDIVYIPNLSEIAVTVGIPSAAALFQKGPAEAAQSVTSFQPQTRVWGGALLNHLERMSLIAMVVIPVALGLFITSADADVKQLTRVAPPAGTNGARDVLRMDGDRDGNAVLFPHQDHKNRLGGEESCGKCHHMDQPNDNWTACHVCHEAMNQPRSIFDHELHQRKIAQDLGLTGSMAANRSCGECHVEGEVKSRETAKDCIVCHEENMRMSRIDTGRRDIAPAYTDAIHASCVGCHNEKAEASNKPHLGRCDTCHEFTPALDEVTHKNTFVRPPRGMDDSRSVLEIDGNRDGRAVTFPHRGHQAFMGDEESCDRCHHLDMPNDRWTACHLCHSNMDDSRSIFHHTLHIRKVGEGLGPNMLETDDRICAECHEDGRLRAGEDAKACVACHEDDMRMKEHAIPRQDLAPGYTHSLHSSCMGCHDKIAEKLDRPELSACSCCHEDM